MSTEYESALSRAMLEQALANQDIRFVLRDVARQLHARILPGLKAILFSTTPPEYSSALPNAFNVLALQHTQGDKFIGALFPDITKQELEAVPEWQKTLITAIDQCLENSGNMATMGDLLSLLKSIDSVSYVYHALKQTQQDSAFLLRQGHIKPTNEEIGMRAIRPQHFQAVTYGLGTQVNKDLQNDNPAGCYSGKAKFFITPPETRGGSVWFEKLADQQKPGKPPLPLIAGPSSSLSRTFIMADDIGLHLKKSGLFDFDQAQIFANCMMGYFVYGGHHSFIEVSEVWNRFLDYLVIEHPHLLQQGIIPDQPGTQRYIDDPDAVERQLPYSHAGDYRSLFHATYADKVIDAANQHIQDGLDLRFQK